MTAPLRERWSTQAHEPSHHVRRQEYIPLLASNGKVFLPDEKGRVICLDAGTQERRWIYPLAVRLGAICDGRLFLWAREQELHVVDCETGVLESAIFSSGADRLAVTVNLAFGYGSDPSYGGSRLWALDWRTGRRLWTEVLPEPVEVSGTFCANEDVLVYSTVKMTADVNAREGRVIARRSSTGEVLWNVPMDPLSGVASLADDRVVGCFGDQIAALRLRDGKVLWQREGTPGYLYGDTYYWVDRRFRYNRMKIASGRAATPIALKTKPRNLLEGYGERRIRLVSETHVFLEAPSQSLVAFTRDAGKYAWSHKPPSPEILGEVVCAGERLYYRNGPDRIYCLGSA